MEKNVIRAALNSNGITKGRVKTHPQNHLVIVYLSGVYYGIYDMEKQTFVD